MYNKLKACGGTLQHKTDLVTKLEDKTNQMAAAITEMEERLKQWYSDKLAAEETSRKLGQQLIDKDTKRLTKMAT
ncbi:hypothetical protein LSAT2_020122 [Lamellibrachia satsuma]|nr:hypothetical protein LSAT2_020122 [Lamellibrachia satsuma]